jgi:hypothetical protein
MATDPSHQAFYHFTYDGSNIMPTQNFLGFSWVTLISFQGSQKYFSILVTTFLRQFFFHGIYMTFVDLDIFAKSLQKVIAKLSRNCGEL